MTINAFVFGRRLCDDDKKIFKSKCIFWITLYNSLYKIEKVENLSRLSFCVRCVVVDATFGRSYE